MLSSRALSRAGYGDVQILDRRQSKQKSRYGGFELLCQGVLGSQQTRVIVKVVRDEVRLRNLDEASGAADRQNADLAIVMSPKRLTKGAERYVKAYRRSRVEVIAGADFASLLRRYHIGVRSRGGVDHAFFTGLEEYGAQVRKLVKRVKP